MDALRAKTVRRQSRPRPHSRAALFRIFRRKACRPRRHSSRSRVVTASISGNAKRTVSVTRRTSPMAALADRWIPKLVLSPSIVISLVFVYGFIFITGYLSLSNSRLMPRYEFVGLDRYRELFDSDVWWTSAANLGWFGIPFIAILLDQRIRNEGALRAVFLYPMALSFIVTGTAWQWILNPNLGMQKVF